MNKLVDIGFDTRLEVEDEGKGTTVVLIHGWPITSFHWRLLSPALHEAGFRTLAVTLRGLGGQSEGGDNLEKITLAREVQLLLRKLDIKNYAIIGHDWGGTVAYLLSHLNLERCLALVVEEEIFPGISVQIPSPGKDFYPEWHGPLNRAIGLAEELLQGRESAYYRRFLVESAGITELEKKAVTEYISAYTSNEKVALQLKYSLGYYRTKVNDIKEIRSCLTKPLKIPILAIGGEYAMGAAVKEGLMSAGDNVSGIVSQGAGHYPIEQTPEFCLPHIIDFLKNHAILKPKKLTKA